MFDAAAQDASPLEAPTPRKARLGEMLVGAGLITADQLELALVHQRTHGGRLGTVLVQMGVLGEEELEGALAQQLGLSVCDVESIHPSPELLRMVPEKLVRKYELIPLSLQGRTLTVGMTDPFNHVAVEELKFATRCNHVVTRLITESTFRRFVTTRFAAARIMDDAISNLENPDRARREASAMDEAQLAPVIRLASHLVEQAVESRASDIHIEPYETFVRVRFRVDGCMYTVMTPPSRLHGGLVSRIKILSEMDISERRRPQDGHMSVQRAGETVHFRVSTLPTVYGEKCVIRLLKKEAHLADLGRLGFDDHQLAIVRRVSRLPQGLVLVTGPTGSGKTTTLHAVLNAINEPDINIVTIEDPVEATIPGINHVQVQERGGVSFAGALRSILRQDPDVVFVGEMRDQEVSNIAIRASLTGHLVFSTLHTNGVVETFSRLGDMGVEPYLMASCLQMVVAQRLLRRLCRCAEQVPLDEATAARWGIPMELAAGAMLRRPVGCRVCLDSGYRGRTAVYEMLEMNEALASVLRRGGSEEDVMAAAKAGGLRLMWPGGIARALAGETSLEEVARVLGRAG